MRLVATEYVSLDGIFDEPGEWSFPYFNDEAMRFKSDELEAAETDIGYTNGRFEVVGTDRHISLFELAARAADMHKRGEIPQSLDTKTTAETRRARSEPRPRTARRVACTGCVAA